MKNTKGGFVLPLLIIVAVLAVGGVLIFRNKSSQNQVDQPLSQNTQSTSPTVQSPSATSETTSLMSQTKNSVASCNSAPNIVECEIKKAAVDHNITFCKNVLDPYLQQECYESIISAFKVSKDCEVFQGIHNQSMLEECYDEVAAKNKDKSICDKLGTADKKDVCLMFYADASGDSSVCPQLSNSDSCWISAARYKQDSSLCTNIKDNYFRDHKCIPFVAAASKNPKACEKFMDLSQKDECYRSLVDQLKDISYCNNTSDPAYCAREVNPASILNYSSCDSLNDPAAKADCAAAFMPQFSRQTLTTDSDCDAFAKKYYPSEPQAAESCHLLAAEAKLDLVACNKLSSPNNKNSCIIYIAFWKKDTTICTNIQDKNYLQACQDSIKTGKASISAFQ
ncbi:MAG TPA: hypothetical protein VGO21_02250 [Candidatus Paceibacterota bacterium]|jgi:hypothetical protein|nr:hypothetical protein [Candidatus Paceibacterota bacterium]